MTARRFIALATSHLLALGVGIAAGIYTLPILIAPSSPGTAIVSEALASSEYRGVFSRDRTDSDALHWGEGDVAIGASSIAFVGSLAPGPDYKLYLSPEYVETESAFTRLKPSMVRVGDVKTFENFLVTMPAGVDVSQYNAVIIWCETFGQFITSARYQ